MYFSSSWKSFSLSADSGRGCCWYTSSSLRSDTSLHFQPFFAKFTQLSSTSSCNSVFVKHFQWFSFGNTNPLNLHPQCHSTFSPVSDCLRTAIVFESSSTDLNKLAFLYAVKFSMNVTDNQIRSCTSSPSHICNMPHTNYLNNTPCKSMLWPISTVAAPGS